MKLNIINNKERKEDYSEFIMMDMLNALVIHPILLVTFITNLNEKISGEITFNKIIQNNDFYLFAFMFSVLVIIPLVLLLSFYFNKKNLNKS